MYPGGKLDRRIWKYEYEYDYDYEYDDQIVYSEVEKSLFKKKIRKEWRQGLLETGSVKNTQRRSMNIRKKNRFHLFGAPYIL